MKSQADFSEIFTGAVSLSNALGTSYATHNQSGALTLSASGNKVVNGWAKISIVSNGNPINIHPDWIQTDGDAISEFNGHTNNLFILNQGDKIVFSNKVSVTDYSLINVYRSVDFYNAKGDGVTDDSSAFQYAFNFAGPKGTVYLTKGKTYIIGNTVTIPSGLKIVGYGAKIKRKDATTTTLTSLASIGAISINVTSTAGFAIGQFFVICDTTLTNGGRGHLENSATSFGAIQQTITNIVGNTITFSNPLAANFPNSSPVVRVYDLFIGSNELTIAGLGNVIEGVEFDGNRANNNITNSWVFNRTINNLPSKSIIVYNTFHDTPAENIFLTNQSTVAHNNFYNCNGSAIHISSIDSSEKGDIIFTGNKMRSMCLATNAVTGHSEAAITFSAYPHRFIATDNHLLGCSEGFCFTGGFSPYFILANNNVQDCTYAFLWSAAFTPICEHFLVQGNHFINCNYVLGGATVATGKSIPKNTSPNDIFIDNNTFVNTKMVLQNQSNFRISANRFITTESFTYSAANDISGVNIIANASASIALDKCTQYEIINNTFDNRNLTPDTRLRAAINCQYAQALNLASLQRIKTDAVTSTEYSYYNRNATVTGNKVLNYELGILDYYGASEITPSRDVSWINFKIGFNQIVLRPGSQGVYGIVAGPGCYVHDNEIYGSRTAGVAAMVILGVNAGNGSTYNIGGTQRLRLNGAIAVRNKVIGAGSSIQLGTGPTPGGFGTNDYGAKLIDNIVDGTIIDNSSGNSTISGTVTLIDETLIIQHVRSNTAFY